jgi:hypothetical protein
MYCDGSLFYLQMRRSAEAGTTSLRDWLPAVRRQSLMRFKPVDQSALGVANGAAELYIRRPVASHARLRQPGLAQAQKGGRILWGEQTLVSAAGFSRRKVLLRHGASTWGVLILPEVLAKLRMRKIPWGI